MKKYSRHQKEGLEFFIKENSWIAKLAAAKLRSQSVAVVLGKTIHLWQVDAASFLKDEKWVRHELCHIRQFQKFGFSTFIIRYLFESLRHGYRNNKYEIEARSAEIN